MAALGWAVVAAAMSSKMPEHSWDTLPVAWHSSYPHGDFGDADVAVLAKYAMVTFEKYQNIDTIPAGSHVQGETCMNGTDLSQCGCCEEDFIVRNARAVKAKNPKTMTIAYMNSIISYPWYRANVEFLTNSTYWLRDVNGSLLNNLRQNPIETWYTWNYGIPAVADLWTEGCTNMTKTGQIDGCFIDGCNQAPGPLTPEVKAAYEKAKPLVLADTQSKVPGVMICGSGGTSMAGVLGSQVQNWGREGDYAGHEIPMILKAAQEGIVFQAHAACGSQDPNDPFEQTKLAAFLVGAGKYAYYMCGGWAGGPNLTWPALYDLPLGEPLSNATLDSEGMYHRCFSKGTNVTYNTKTNNGTIQWAKAK